MKKRLATVAVGLLAGVWLVRGLSDAEAPQVGAAPAAAVAAAAPIASRQPRIPAAAAEVRADPLSREPPGKQRLEGQVVDEAQMPVADARVTVSAIPPASTLTERDGSFAFDGLLQRTYVVRARSGQRAGGPVEVRLTAHSEPVILTLHATPTIEVLVVDASARRPMSGVQVRVENVDQSMVETDARGRALLEGFGPGSYVVEARKTGFAAARKSVFHAARGSLPTPLLLTLQTGAALSGRVTSTSGKPVHGARLRAVRSDSLQLDGGNIQDQTSSRADGTFEFAALPAGTFRVAGVHPLFAPGLSAPVRLDGTISRAGVQVTLAPGARLTGRVRDAAGAVVSSAIVDVRPAAEGSVAPDWGRTAFTDEEGEFQVEGLPAALVRVDARVDSASASPREVDLASGGADVTLTLDVDGVICGTVSTSDGAGAEGAQVVAIPDVGNPLAVLADSKTGRYAADVSDGAGAFCLRGLEPGQYRVRAAVGLSVQSGAFWLDPGVVASPGDRDVRIVVQQRGSLRGHVQFAGGKPAHRFSVALTLSQAQVFSDPQGAFTMRDVPPGPQSVTVSATGFSPRTIDLQLGSGEQKDLGTVVLQPGRALAGHVTADGAPAAGAVVIAGANLLGDGSDPGDSAVRVRTSAAGSFSLAGVGDGALTVLAEHPTLGRSAPVQVPAGSDSPPLELVLLPTSGLDGVVSRAGRPLGRIPVVATPAGISTGRFMVLTQADGRYRFDRLARGNYVVTASVQTGPLSQLLASVTAQVDDATDTRADIDIATGEEIVQPRVLEDDGRPLANAQIYVVSGALEARTLSGLEDALASRGAGLTRILYFVRGRVVPVRDASAGAYTLCAVPIRGNLEDPTVLQRLRDHAADLPCFCAPFTVGRGGGVTEPELRVPKLLVQGPG